MEQQATTLLQNGTITSIFLSCLLVAISAFAIWAKQLISSQLKLKDERITLLEKDVKELQHNYKTELIGMIGENQRLMQKSNDTFNRIEDILDRMK